MPSYEILRLIWWALLGVLLIGVAVMDGFDLGTAILLPFVGKTDVERRIVINTVGPGLGGQSGLADPRRRRDLRGMAATLRGRLFRLLSRDVPGAVRADPAAGRVQVPVEAHRSDLAGGVGLALFVGGLVPALIFGVAFGNVLQGVPFRFDETMRMTYEGNLLGLLNPFALLCGLVSVAMLTMHGGAYLALKAEEPVAARAADFAARAAMALIAAVRDRRHLGRLPHRRIRSPGRRRARRPVKSAPQTVVATSAGAWLANYGQQPLTLAAPILGFGGAVLTIVLLRSPKSFAFAIVASALSVAGVIATAGLSIFPFLLPSSLDPSAGLIVWDASSSRLTLFIMLIATLVFLPIVLVYTAWVYRVLRGRVTAAYVTANSTGVY